MFSSVRFRARSHQYRQAKRHWTQLQDMPVQTHRELFHVGAPMQNRYKTSEIQNSYKFLGDSVPDFLTTATPFQLSGEPQTTQNINLQNHVLENAWRFAFSWVIRALLPPRKAPSDSPEGGAWEAERGFKGLTAFKFCKSWRVFDCCFGVKKWLLSSNGAAAGLQRARRHVATGPPLQCNSSPVAEQ